MKFYFKIQVPWLPTHPQLEGHTPQSAITPHCAPPPPPAGPPRKSPPPNKMTNDAKQAFISTKSPYQMLKVLKRASNTFIFLYFCLNQDNLYVNSLISIIISLIYESGTYGLK